MLSSSFLASTLPFSLASSSANFSASLIIFSMSSGVGLFWSLVMVIFSLEPVPLSSAETTRIPLASISKVTSICGTPRGAGGDVGQVELAELVVVLGHGSLSLEDLDGDGVLVVSGGGEDLRLLSGDDGVPRDQLGHHTSDGLDTHGKRVDIEQHNLTSILLSGKHTGLDGGSIGDGLVGVDASAWLLAVEELLHQALHLGDPCGTTDQHNLVNLLLGQISILEHLLYWLESSPEEIHVELLELGPGQSLGEVLALEQGLNLHTDLVSCRKRPLGLLNLPPQLLNSPHVLPQVLALLLLVQLDEVVHHPLVEVFTSKMGVSVGCDDLKDSVVDSKKGDIEGATTKIEHKDILLALLLVHAVGDS